MIGIVHATHETAVAQEFFELFKTPWEPYASGRNYEVLIVTSGELPSDADATLIVIYGSNSTSFDTAAVTHLERKSADHCMWVEGDGIEIPVYGELSAVGSNTRSFLRLKNRADCVACELEGTNRQIFRIGYNLFDEVRLLLSNGQPLSNAHIPTLELHISILRECIRNAGIPFAEILSRPYGYDFAASLTHDVDFVGIRDHKFDPTMWGFVYRASIGTLVSLAKGRSTWSRCLENWKALASLPLVHLGLCKDFWIEFDRYTEIERGLNPTFFFIPFRDEPGTWNGRPAPSRRAAKYDVGHLREAIRKLAEQGCEIGLHGLNAWRDRESAIVERKRIGEVFEQSETGVRMHWLYMNEQSPTILQDTGFAYDSTFGYNDAIGFRAGTAQAFCPIGTSRLVELPMIIQDTAMFYPNRMNLFEDQAMDRCLEIVRWIVKCGGALTINWHTRSLSPERLWDEFYKALLVHIKQSRVWFCTAGANAKWFRARRAVRFDSIGTGEELRLTMDHPVPDELPPLTIRVYGSGKGGHLSACDHDVGWRGGSDLPICLGSPARI